MAKKRASADTDPIVDAAAIDSEPAETSLPRQPDPNFPTDRDLAGTLRIADSAEVPHDDDLHESHRSIKSRLLSALAIFLVGAVVALWAGPKIAPNLPAGLAPVARWLMPGQDAALAAVEQATAALSARIDAVPVGVGQAQVAGLIDAAIAPVAQGLETRVSALESAAPGEDSQLASELSGLEVQVSGLAAELAALASQPVAAADGIAPSPVEITRLTARLDGLQARIAELSSQQAVLKQQVETVAKEARANIASAQTELAAAATEAEAIRQSAEVQALLTTITAAMSSGAPFAEALDAFADLTGAEAPAALAAFSAQGLPTLLSLRDAFPQAAHEAIRAATMAEAGAGLAARVGGFLQAQVATRSLSPQPGPGADAVLSRAEESLRNGDLAQAVSEAKSLPAAATAAFADWLANAEAVLAAEAALTELATTAPAAN